MHGGVDMMHRVKAVVEGEKIQQTPCKVPARIEIDHCRRRVRLARYVTAIVLQHVHRNNAPLCRNVWDVHVKQETPPIKQPQPKTGQYDYSPLHTRFGKTFLVVRTATPLHVEKTQVCAEHTRGHR